MRHVLEPLDLLPASAVSNGEPRPLPGKLLELVPQDAVAVDLERGRTVAPHLLDDCDGAQRILLAEQPPDPDDADRLVGPEEPGVRRRKVSQRERDVFRSDAIAAASTRDTGSRERNRLRQPQHRSRDQQLEDAAQESVVQERARRERCARAVQDEQHAFAAQPGRHGRKVREEVARPVCDDDVGVPDFAPEQPPSSDRQRPAGRAQESARQSDVGRRGSFRRPAGKHANAASAITQQPGGDVDELLDSTAAGQDEARDDQHARGGHQKRGAPSKRRPSSRVPQNHSTRKTT